MAPTPFSLLLRRRLLFLSYQNSKLPFLSLVLSHQSPKLLSTSHPNPSSDPPKPSSLSARMSFVFDQIDAIERERSQKDETLQRIRAWRQSKNSRQDPEPESQLGGTDDAGCGSSAEPSSVQSRALEVELKKEREVELVHPWPEWIELMERLVQQNYFDHRRKDEDRMVQDLGFDASDVSGDDVGIDFNRDFKAVQTACLNFGKDRFDILRSLSRQDIQILVGYGCPSADKKVVFSAKLLRKHVHLDEGDVCSSCSLRSSCERAYLLTNKEDEARTIDVMRVLLTFGYDPVNGYVVNKSILKQKSVKTVVRKLLHEVVKLSAVPIDPNLPPPVIKKPPPKVKQPPPPPKKRVGRDDIEMKKGDWLCPKCDFMNFAKNIVCLQCDAKRPKRQLLPGEWECPECNFLNYRRNMACFHCECKRPPEEFSEHKMQERPHRSRTRLEKIANQPEISNAWNFDFDDNESDGADVAAFEYADSSVRDDSLNGRAHGGNFRGPQDDFNEARGVLKFPGREYSNGDNDRHGAGFDDFNDEDDIDSYELDTKNNNPVRKAHSKKISDVEGFSESEDTENVNDNMTAIYRASSSSYNKHSKPTRQRAAISDSEDDKLGFDSDEELSVHPSWKSCHVADAGHQSRGRIPAKRLSFGSDDDLMVDSDIDGDLDEDLGSKENRGHRLSSGRRDTQRGNSRIKGSSSGTESDIDDVDSWKNRSRGNKFEPNRRGNSFKGRGSHNFVRNTEFGSKNRTHRTSSSNSGDFDRSSRGSRGGNRGFSEEGYGGGRMNGRKGDYQKFNEPRRGDGFRNRQQESGRSSGKYKNVDGDVGEFRNSRRVIER